MAGPQSSLQVPTDAQSGVCKHCSNQLCRPAHRRSSFVLLPLPDMVPYLHRGGDLVDGPLDEVQRQRLHQQELHAVVAQLRGPRDVRQRDGPLVRRPAAGSKAEGMSSRELGELGSYA
jgi:hypothetical protein